MLYKLLKYLLLRLSFVPVLSFPSENVPAPPSPNCTFEFTLSMPVLQKDFTSFCLSSTLLPRSIIIGQAPDCAKINPQKSPQGPAPIITGDSCGLLTFLLYIHMALPQKRNFFISFDDIGFFN